MHALANAGQMSNHRYIELTYVVAENEEEEEQRDYSRICKITQSVLPHSQYACIGSSTCLKQKNIRKLFPQTLKQCEQSNQANEVQAKKLGHSSTLNPEAVTQSFLSMGSKAISGQGTNVSLGSAL
jgi:hypothetical protein